MCSQIGPNCPGPPRGHTEERKSPLGGVWRELEGGWSDKGSRLPPTHTHAPTRPLPRALGLIPVVPGGVADLQSAVVGHGALVPLREVGGAAFGLAPEREGEVAVGARRKGQARAPFLLKKQTKKKHATKHGAVHRCETRNKVRTEQTKRRWKGQCVGRECLLNA
jgi:hypothetical protein